MEQIFLDINEKAQLLDTEDIFKGHCFEIFAPEFHSNLRETWVELKKCASGFRALGIKSLSDYIYLFLLEHDGTDLPKKLNPNGRHYLEGKTMDETNSLLQEMISYLTVVASPQDQAVVVHEGIDFFDSYQREHKGDEK